MATAKTRSHPPPRMPDAARSSVRNSASQSAAAPSMQVAQSVTKPISTSWVMSSRPVAEPPDAGSNRRARCR